VVRLQGPRSLRPAIEPVPEPGEGEALIRVTAVGLCGSDLHWFQDGTIGEAGLDRPLVLGHEFAGVIESGPRRGERVAVDPAIPCGTCASCRNGDPNLCPAVRFAGYSPTDGALRRYMTWPVANLYSLPDALSDADGALLETLGIALHALDLGHVRVGMTVGVFGLGPVGLLLARLAGVAGASRIVGTDLLDHRLEAGTSLGVEVFRADAGGGERAAILERLGRDGVDVAFEAAGASDAVETAVEVTRPGGRVVVVGIPPDDRITLRASSARRKGLTLAFSRRMKHTYERATGLAVSGAVDLSSMVTHRFPLEETAAAFELLERREGIKVVVELG
jgi:L-iditol 2-dehydrogenase